MALALHYFVIVFPSLFSSLHPLSFLKGMRLHECTCPRNGIALMFAFKSRSVFACLFEVIR